MRGWIQGLGVLGFGVLGYISYIGLLENKMETTIMENQMEKILGLYWDSRRENGNYYSGFRVKWYFRVFGIARNNAESNGKNGK